MNRMPIVHVTCVVLFALTPVALAGPPHFAGDRPLDMKHIKLDLTVDLAAKTVDAKARLDLTALRPVTSITLDAVDFDASAVRVGFGGGSPSPCSFENDGKHLTLSLPRQLDTGGDMTILIDYRLDDPKSGLNFFAPSDDDPEAPYVVWSQGQTTTNRYWVPCFDHPNEMQTSEIVCTVKKPYIVISNGTLLSEKDNGDGTRTFHWKQNQPHVSYLMTLVVGDFVSRTETWRGKPITYHVRKKFEKDMHNSFRSTLAMLDFFSDKIGVEYPWDKYAQVCCYQFGGGMENTSSTTLGERTLHDDRAHLDTSSDGLVAHELAHQWWGDLLTCKEWSHTWLNEGFASYFEALWDEHHNGRDAFAYNMFGKARRARSGGKEKPIVYRDYEQAWEQFDSRAYPKGAWVLHMIRNRLGDDLFWKCINTYCKRFRHKTVETSDLRQTIEAVTGRSFERFFHDWTERTGHPVMTVKYQWLAEDGLAQVDIEQTQEAEAFHFPLKLEFHFANGENAVTLVKKITDKKAGFMVPLAARPTMFRVDPGNTVLKEMTLELPRDLWVARLTRDDDVVARIGAAQHFGKSQSQQDLGLLAGRLSEESFWAVRAEIARALGKSKGDKARDALLANIATEHPKARAAIVEALGGFDDEPAVAKSLRRLAADGDPSYRVEANAIEAYARLRPDDAVAFLASVLDRDSHREMIRTAALRGLGDQRDPAAVETLIAWTQPGNPLNCRTAAVDALGSLLSKTDVDDETRATAVESMVACLKVKTRRGLPSVLEALGALGSDARFALPTIDDLAENGRPRIRGAAKRAAKAIREDQPSRSRLSELEKKLDEVREENKRLRDRLEKIESRTHTRTELK